MVVYTIGTPLGLCLILSEEDFSLKKPRLLLPYNNNACPLTFEGFPVPTNFTHPENTSTSILLNVIYA